MCLAHESIKLEKAILVLGLYDGEGPLTKKVETREEEKGRWSIECICDNLSGL
jgi:hypothetical protein